MPKIFSVSFSVVKNVVKSGEQKILKLFNTKGVQCSHKNEVMGS